MRDRRAPSRRSADSQLQVDRRQMAFDGSRAERHRVRDLVVRPALRAQGNDLALTRGERLERPAPESRALGLEKHRELADEGPPGRLALEKDVVRAVERDQ